MEKIIFLFHFRSTLVSIITLPESNVNVSENVVLQPDVSLPVIQDVAKIYIKPNINVRNKLNKKGVYNLSKREDKFDLDAEVDGNKIKIKGLRTTKDIDVVFGRSNGANSDFIYAEVDEIENAEVRVKHDKLVLSGVATGRNPILICNNFSISTLECDEWSPTGDYAYDGGMALYPLDAHAYVALLRIRKAGKQCKKQYDNCNKHCAESYYKSFFHQFTLNHPVALAM